MVIYLSFDRALNNKSVHCQYVQDMCPVYFADCPFCCVWFLVSEGGLVYSVRCSLSWVTGQFLSHNPHSLSQSSFSGLQVPHVCQAIQTHNYKCTMSKEGLKKQI